MHDTKRRLRERGFSNPVLLLHPLGTDQRTNSTFLHRGASFYKTGLSVMPRRLLPKSPEKTLRLSIFNCYHDNK